MPRSRRLFPGVSLHPSSWKLRAACRNSDPEIFFPTKGEHLKTQTALWLCGRCPVRKECLDEALLAYDEWGIRGGLTGNQRREILRGCRTPDVA